MSPKNKRKPLKADQLQALPVSISEARKLLGGVARNMSDHDIVIQVLLLNEVAIFLINDINLRKMHL